MSASPGPASQALDSALLLLSRRPADLARLLQRALDEAELARLARGSGHRKRGRPDPAAQLAEVVAVHPRLRGQVAASLDAALPEANGEPAEDAPLPDRLGSWLRRDELACWERAAAALAESDWNWPAAAPAAPAASADPPPAADGQQASGKPAPGVGGAAPAATGGTGTDLAAALRELEARHAEKLAHLQGQLLTARRESAELQAQLGAARRERDASEKARLDAGALAEQERQRATELKQQLASVNEASERERALEEANARLRHDLNVIAQKLVWIEEERDDLRGVLEDYDRFEAVVEEDVPSFRDRPLTDLEQRLTRQLAARHEAGKPRFRVLVVGGGPPQHRHRDKLDEYAEAMGFTATWRMAEYQAWHRALDSLRRDMQERFDALIILHWNRTTFTRKAREICDTDGAKPCLTCHYEGFTNLRETLQECLRELLAAERRAAG